MHPLAAPDVEVAPRNDQVVPSSLHIEMNAHHAYLPRNRQMQTPLARMASEWIYTELFRKLEMAMRIRESQEIARRGYAEYCSLLPSGA